MRVALKQARWQLPELVIILLAKYGGTLPEIKILYSFVRRDRSLDVELARPGVKTGAEVDVADVAKTQKLSHIWLTRMLSTCLR